MSDRHVSAETKTKKSAWSDYFSWDESKMIKKITKDHIYSLLKKDNSWKKLIKKDVSDNSIDDDKIKDGAVGTDKLANGAVTVAKMSSNSCTNGQILKFDGTAWACAADSDSDTLGSAIDSSEITDGTIVEADLANGAVTVAKMSSNSCTNGQILKFDGTAWACAADSDSDILGSAIDSSEITDGAIVNADINASAAIATSKINFTNQNVNLRSGTLTSAQLFLGDSETNFGVTFMPAVSWLSIQPTAEIHDFIFHDADIRLDGTNDVELPEGSNILFSSSQEDGSKIIFGGGTIFPEISLVRSDPSTDMSYNYNTGQYYGVNFKVSEGGGYPYKTFVKIDNLLKLEPASVVPFPCGDSAEGEGFIYYNSTDHKLKICNGTAWVDLN
jgi:hypothetical protein